MKRYCLYALLSVWALMAEAGNYGKIIKYEVLSNGDSVCWKVSIRGAYEAVFLKDLPAYTYERKTRQFQMEYNADKVTYPVRWPPALEYERYANAHYDVLTTFFVQLLTYEERKAILDRGGVIWFRCAVNADGRVCLIPDFNVSSYLVEAGFFPAERLYELARHIKNNAQFPLPPASMTFGCMFQTCGIFHVNAGYSSGVLYESIYEYD